MLSSFGKASNRGLKLCFIIFMLQMCHVFCNNMDSESLRGATKKTFGYDCDVKPVIGEILYWKISVHQVNRHTQFWELFRKPAQFQLQEFSRGVTQFQSNETYVILSRPEQDRFHIFSWVGSQASLDDKKEAAKYMIQHYWQLKIYYRYKLGGSYSTMSRERENIESELFQHIIISPLENFNNCIYNYYQQTGKLLTYPNLYIVRGVGNTTCMKKVPMGTLWLKNDTCMIVETGYNVNGYLNVYIHCGTATSVEARNRASHFASLHAQYGIFLGKFLKTISTTNFPRMKQFVELLEDTNYYRFNEVDNSNDHLKDAETFVNDCHARISLGIISSDFSTITEGSSYDILEGTLLKEEITERPIFSNNKRMLHANLIFNTGSISGVFVQFGSNNPKVEEAVITMKHAEEYIHGIESNIPRPIPLQIDGAGFSGPTIVAVDLKINFVDYPPQIRG